MDATLASTLVSGPTAPSASSATLTGDVDVDGVWNPKLRLGLSAALRAPFGAEGRGDVGASWGLWRDQALCDTCDDGAGPGWLGRELLGSTDLTLTAGHRLDLGDGGTTLRVAALAVLPASKDALWCNPMLGAPGASAALTVPAAGSALTASARASRPIYLNNAAPVGVCSPRGEGVQTLTGAVLPTPWDGARTALPNPTFTGSVGAAWTNPHALWSGAPERLSTRLTAGLDAQRDPVDPAVAVDTLSGDVAVAPSARPITATVPWSMGAGWRLDDALDLNLTLANRLPTWIADPGGAFRAIPARTAVTLSATGHL